MKNEAAIKTAAVSSVRSQGGYARRIEDQYAVGTLDTVMVLEDMPVVFAEFKMIHGNTFKPTDRQLVEMRRIDAAKGKCMAVLIGWRGGQHFFTRTVERAELDRCFAQPEGTTFAEALGAFLNKEMTNE